MRMRVVFATDESVKYVGHLDLARAWERAIRRAGLPLSYSQGFHPQPRIQFAAALPVGFTGAAEVMDIFLDETLEAGEVMAKLAPALPMGIRPISASPVPDNAAALQSLLRGACYDVEVRSGDSDLDFQALIAAFLARPAAWRERRRGKQVSRYDLRPLVQAIRYLGPCALGQAFETDMRCEPGATGRPDELLAELGFEGAARRIRRLRLVFAEA